MVYPTQVVPKMMHRIESLCHKKPEILRCAQDDKSALGNRNELQHRRKTLGTRSVLCSSSIWAPKFHLSGGVGMKKTTAVLTVIAFFAACSAVYAEYITFNEGRWPESWPKELEPLRKQSRTLEGPMVLTRHYLIPFTKREQFEAAWPHLLKVKSKGAPLILVRGPKTDFMAVQPAGVLIHTPPDGTETNAKAATIANMRMGNLPQEMDAAKYPARAQSFCELDHGQWIGRRSVAASSTPKAGAARGTRTPDPVITNDVLYQLSYCGGPSKKRVPHGAERVRT